MLGVVEEGTGASAAVEGYAVGGGPVQPRSCPWKWKISCFFHRICTKENPQVMVYVVIDEPNSAVQANSGYATQLASQIMTQIYFLILNREKTVRLIRREDNNTDSTGIVVKVYGIITS